jgi:basic amino acid/polyamine antiporter, APA family
MNFKEFWTFMTTDRSKTKKEISISTQQQTKGASHTTMAQPKLKKLGYGVVLFILINSILGSSLFYLPGLGVITSGAASIIAWFALFLIAFFVMLYIGELITLHPTSGGTYEFCKRAYGRFGSFAAGWLIWLAGNFGMALAIVAAAEYFIPQQTQYGFILRLVFAAIWIITLNFMAFRGVDAGSTMLVVFGIIAVIVVTLMTLPSFIDIPALFQGVLQSPFNSQFLQPFFQHEGLSILTYLGLSLLLVSEAFLGFEVVSYMANEVENPKGLHKVLVKGMLISGVLMTLYVFSSLGTVPYGEYVQDARPFAVQALNTMGELGQMIVVFGMYLVIVGAAAAWPITGARLLQAMAKDKLFLQHFVVLHPRHGSAYRAVMLQTVMVGLFSWFIFRGYLVNWGNPYRSIYLVYVVLSLIVLSLILLTVPVLRRKEKDLHRPYKAPLGTTGPIFLVTLFLILLVNWIRIEGGTALSTLQLAGSFVIFGLPLYFFVEMLYSEKSIRGVNERLSFLVLWGEKLFFPLTIRNKLLKDMGDVKGKKILEYGCSVGSLTRKLAPRVGASGRIYATDLSLKKVKIADKRTKEHPHVSVHHEQSLEDFTVQLPEKVDGVLSVGMLSYMQKPEQILTSLGKHVKKDGEIVFLDYDKFFYVIPNVQWIKDTKELIAMFKRAGFSVELEKKYGLLWQYIIIKGTKD